MEVERGPESDRSGARETMSCAESGVVVVRWSCCFAAHMKGNCSCPAKASLAPISIFRSF